MFKQQTPLGRLTVYKPAISFLFLLIIVDRATQQTSPFVGKTIINHPWLGMVTMAVCQCHWMKLLTWKGQTPSQRERLHVSGRQRNVKHTRGSLPRPGQKGSKMAESPTWWHDTRRKDAARDAAVPWDGDFAAKRWLRGGGSRSETRVLICFLIKW